MTASGYLVKNDDGDKLAVAIRTVHTGQLALTAELMTLINDDPSKWAAADEPVDDIRSLVHEYPHPTGPA